MNVSILVGTYGTDEWLTLGARAANAAREACPGAQVVTQHEELETLATVRNRLARVATGDWLCFLDADDRLGDGFMTAMQAAAGRVAPADAPALLIPAVQYVDARGDCTGVATVPAWGRLVYEVNTAVIGTLVPRQLFLDVGGFHEQPIYEDWDLWLRCLTAGVRPVAVPDAVYCADGEPGRNQGDAALRDRVYWQIRNEREPQLQGVRWE